jgi:hypothetical protein
MCFALKWPKEWSGTDILRDMTYLEIIPIALAIFLWFDRFQLKNILFLGSSHIQTTTKARPAGNAFPQNANEPHIDCNSFNVTFFL